jgi:hypothetical protein
LLLDQGKTGTAPEQSWSSPALVAAKPDWLETRLVGNPIGEKHDQGLMR